MSRLNSIRAGKGPVFIMLHGLFGDADNFRSVALHMERHFDIVRIDLPGHGKSPSLPQLTIESLADAVYEEILSLGVSQCHLLGHSLGGKVAMSLAGRHSGIDLTSLCIVDIAPKLYEPHHEGIIDALQSVDLDSLNSRKEAESQLRPRIDDAGIRAFLLKSLYKTESQSFNWRFDLTRLSKDYTHIRQAPVVKQTIHAPTMFIKGQLSDYLQSEDESIIKELFNKPTLKIIAGTGHWPHAEKPAQFTRLCLEFAQANEA